MATEHQGSNPHTDKTIYETTQNYLKAALEHTIATGHSVKDFSEFALEKFGDNALPHIRHFFQDVREGQIRIKGMARAAKMRIVGLHVSAVEREEMIRVAAYLRAEKCGFTGSTPEQDWHQAEKEVDALLEHEAGLVEKGHRVLTSASTIVEQEYDHVKHIVSDWIEHRHGDTSMAGNKKEARKSSAPKKIYTKPSPDKPVKKSGQKKTEAKKKAAPRANSAPKKKSAPKKNKSGKK